jgi:hypothetical protein
MRRLHEEPQEIRVPSEALARWALETTIAAQEATGSALSFLVNTSHAATTQLPVPQLLRSSQAIQDPDGFLRMPRGAVEHFRLRTHRAMAWMDLFIFFRERFPAAAARQPPEALYSMGQLFSRHDDELHAALDLVVRECVMPEIEDLLFRTVKYPPLQLLFQRLRENDPQRSAEARRLAATIIEDPSGAKVWKIRTRLIATATRALLAAKPLLDELERGGFKVERSRAARGFARRLEEAVGELPGAPILESLLHQLAGDHGPGEAEGENKPESFQTSSYND